MLSNQKRILNILVIFFFACIAVEASAVMPPQHYATLSEESKIKAIAIVDKIDVIEKTKRYTTKRATFRLEFAATPGVPEVFSGICKSVDHQWQEPGAGGDVFIYPATGERVYVTVSSNGSSITSYTKLTPQLETAVKQAPETIRYGFSSATVDDSFRPADVSGSNVNKKSSNEKSTMDSEGALQGPEPDQGELIGALGLNDLEAVEYLLSRGLDVNYAYGPEGLTSMMMAESPEMIELLHRNGGDALKVDKDGANVLHYAVMKDRALEMIPLLISWGADVNQVAPGRNGETPMITAAQLFFEGRDQQHGTKVIRLLVDRSANVNAADRDGYTILITGAVNDKPELVKVALESGANANQKSAEGKTALDYARELNSKKAIKVLESAK